MGYIYKITNKISGKIYIGETKEEDVERRWKGHINAIKHDRGCPAFQDAVRKYGIDNFKFEIVVICFDENRYAMAKAIGKQINKIQNEKIINTYKSIADAARQNNIPNSTMKRAVKEHVEARGFIWQEVPKDMAQ